MKDNRQKITNTLTIARKAGKVALGFDACLDAVKAGICPLILYGKDISPKTLKEICFLTEKHAPDKVKILGTDFTKEDYGLILRKTVGLVGVLDEGFSKKILELL